MLPDERAFCTDISESPKPQVTRTPWRCASTAIAGACYAGNTRKSIRANTKRGRTVWGMAYSRAPMPCTTLRELYGVSITQSAIQQDAMSCNQAEVGEEYQQLRASMKDAKRVFTDDTGWRINGESAYMMGFDTD